MSHEPYDALAAAHALGALDGADRAEFERHLGGGCAVCEAALRASAEALAALARAEPSIMPPPEVKEELLRRIAATTSARLVAARPRTVVWAVGTLVAVIAGAAFTGAYVAARYEGRLGQMVHEAVALRERVHRDEASLREQVAVYRSAVDLLRDPTTRIVALHGLGASPEATGRVIWHPREGGHVFVANLPSAPRGKAYEMWMIGDSAPLSAGVFQVDASGRGSHRIPAVAGGKPVEAFAVTLEPETGVAAPTGPRVLVSK